MCTLYIKLFSNDITRDKRMTFPLSILMHEICQDRPTRTSIYARAFCSSVKVVSFRRLAPEGITSRRLFMNILSWALLFFSIWLWIDREWYSLLLILKIGRSSVPSKLVVKISILCYRFYWINVSGDLSLGSSRDKNYSLICFVKL